MFIEIENQNQKIEKSTNQEIKNWFNITNINLWKIENNFLTTVKFF